MVNPLKAIVVLMVISSACFATELRSLYVTDPISGVQAKVDSDGQLHTAMYSKTDTNNSTRVNLASNAVFTGTASSLMPYGAISILVETDAASGDRGFEVQYSSDAIEWHVGESYSIPAGSEKFYTPPVWMEYYRIVYSNGPVATTDLHIHSMLHKNTMKWSSHNVNDEIKDDDDAELGVSVIHAKNPSGVYGPIQRSDDGNLLIHDAENPSAIAFGDVPGKSIVQKFGNAPDFDTLDGRITITDLANDAGYDQMQYIYSTNASIDSIISSDATDTQVVQVQGLGATTNLVIQNATLNGQTRVALATNLYRIFRIKNQGSTDFVGDVTCYETNAPTTAGVVDNSNVARAMVNDGNNQTEMAIFTVPAGKHLIIHSLYYSSVGANKSSVYKCSIWVRPPNGVFQLKWNKSFSDDNESGIYHPYKTGLYVDEGHDIELRVESIATPAVIEATISAGFEIEMKDK